MTAISDVVHEIALLISAKVNSSGVRVRVGVDGRDGAGKTTFADLLAVALRDGGAEVHRASIDDFQNSSAIRYSRGRENPQGYYHDGFDVDGLTRELLDPFAPGGSGLGRLVLFDVESDRELVGEPVLAGPRSILICDGVFLHRPELVDRWEVSIYLRVDPDIALARGLARDIERSHDEALERRLYQRRYAPAQEIYHEAVNPGLVADIVVDNSDLERPYLVRGYSRFPGSEIPRRSSSR